MSRRASFPAFLEPERVKARRLYEVEGLRFEDIALRFGVTKGSIAGLAFRQQWLRQGETERRTVRRKPRPPAAPVPQHPTDTIAPGPRGTPAGRPNETSPTARPSVELAAAPPAPVEAPDPTTAGGEAAGPPEAERGTPPAAVVEAEEMDAGASSAAPAVPNGAAAPDGAAAVVAMPDADQPEPAAVETSSVRPRVARLADGQDRTTAERSLDTVLGHARARAAPPVLSAPLSAVPPARHRVCQWPEGEPGTSGFRFCEAPVVPSRSYCLEHCQVAYVRLASRKDIAA